MSGEAAGGGGGGCRAPSLSAGAPRDSRLVGEDLRLSQRVGSLQGRAAGGSSALARAADGPGTRPGHRGGLHTAHRARHDGAGHCRDAQRVPHDPSFRSQALRRRRLSRWSRTGRCMRSAPGTAVQLASLPCCAERRKGAGPKWVATPSRRPSDPAHSTIGDNAGVPGSSQGLRGARGAGPADHRRGSPRSWRRSGPAGRPVRSQAAAGPAGPPDGHRQRAGVRRRSAN